MNKPKVKIITIAVTYDPQRDGDPADWHWAEMTDELDNGPDIANADIKIMTQNASELLEEEYGDGIWNRAHNLAVNENLEVSVIKE